ncbi:MAG: hypothetical protein AAFV49_10270 [Pseudomonadota bacterium]
MTARPALNSNQLQLIPPSTRPVIPVNEDHPLVQLTRIIDWGELARVAQKIRRSKLRSHTGRPPNLRVMLGAIVFMAVRRRPYREVEELIRHYAPARYLCGLTETTWSPDYCTIMDFTHLMGPEGLQSLNEAVVKMAAEAGFADPSLLVADTTAQEAPTSYPTEVRLLDRFFRSAARLAKRSGTLARNALADTLETFTKGLNQLRRYRFLAKSKQERLSATSKALSAAKKVVSKFKEALKKSRPNRLKGANKIARRTLGKLLETMGRLMPQIDHYLACGFPAKGKIVSLSIPESCAIPRGKVGKDTEFGIKWGVERIGGGFITGQADPRLGNFSDKKHVPLALEHHQALFGEMPTGFAYDRGADSQKNDQLLAKAGVKHNAIAPSQGRPWKVDGKVRKHLANERARIEGDIGSIKHEKYGFNRPAARSARAMIACGHRAMLGYNLTKMLRLSTIAG